MKKIKGVHAKPELNLKYNGTVRAKKRRNRKTTLKQQVSVFYGVTKQTVMLVTYLITYKL